MAVQVKERTIEEIEDRLNTMSTPLNKIVYLESALKEGNFSFEIKRFLLDTLSKLYEERKMFGKAAEAMANKAGIEISSREKMESYLASAEFFAKVGRIEDAENMFVRALRTAKPEQKARIKLARKNIYLASAKELESKGKKASAVKFYEKLIKMNLEDIEKEEIRETLLKTYRALGLFREAELLEGA